MKAILEDVYNRAWKNQESATGCAQSVIAALQDCVDFVPKNDDVFKASSALAGGLGSSNQGTCGALSAGVMIISHLFGRSREEFEQHRQRADVDFLDEGAKCWRLAYELTERFLLEYGSCTCKDVMKRMYGKNLEGIRPDSPVAYAFARSYSQHPSGGSRSVVATVARWTAELLIVRKEQISNIGDTRHLA